MLWRRGVSYLRLMDSCFTRLTAQGPSRTCNESNEGEEVAATSRARKRHPRASAPLLCTGGPDVIRKEAWPFYRKISGVRLYWELEEPKGPTGPPPWMYDLITSPTSYTHHHRKVTSLTPHTYHHRKRFRVAGLGPSGPYEERKRG